MEKWRVEITEEEWLACREPRLLIDAYQATDRKLRLFACACCHRATPNEYLNHENWMSDIALGEAVADGVLPKSVLLENDGCWASWTSAERGAQLAATFVGGEDPEEQAAQAEIFRDLVGNPWRKSPLPWKRSVYSIDGNGSAAHDNTGITVVEYHCDWLSPTVRNLTGIVYGNRKDGELDKFLLKNIADALEDAGCNHEQLLGHLRSDGLHYKGCWAVDLLLGME